MAKKPAPPAGNASKLNALLKQAKAAWKGSKDPEPPPAHDPATQLIVAFLTWNATIKQADEAHGKLMADLVDNHDLRVSHAHELVALIGEDYPGVWERCLRLKESLHEVYLREHDLVLKSVGGKNKKEQRAYFDSLPGITPYVASRVLLLSYEHPALPVDDKLCALLVAEGVFSEDIRPADAERFLLTVIKPDQALEAHAALQHWSDKRKAPPRPAGARPRKKTAKKK